MAPKKKTNDADSIGVRVRPDTTGFAEDLRAVLARIQETVQLSLKVDLDTTGMIAQARAAAKAAQEAADSQTAPKAPAEPRAPTKEKATPAPKQKQDTDAVDAAYRAKIQAEIKALAAQATKIPAGIDGEKLREDLRAKLKEAESAIKGDIPIGADGTEFRTKLEGILADARASTEHLVIKPEIVDPPAPADPIDSAYRAKVQAEIKAIAAEASSIPAGIDGDALREELRAKLAAATAAIKGDIPVGADGTLFRAELEATLAAARASIPTVQVEADADTTKAKAKLDVLEAVRRKVTVVADLNTRALDTAKLTATRVGIVGIAAAGISATGSVASLAGSLTAVAGVGALLPAVVGSLAAIGGTAATALSGVGTALGAVSKAAKPQTGGPDPRLEAMQVRDAKQAIVDAEENAADSIARADRNVADSKRSLLDTLRDVADANAKAAKAAIDAEKALGLAQRDVSDAQKALNKARADAVTGLRDLDSQLKNAGLSEREAAVKYQDAMDAYTQALTDPSKSATAVAALRLEMDKSAQALEDSRSKVTDLQAAKAKAAAEEKTGSEAVQMAARNLADAQDRAGEAAYRKQQADRDAAQGDVEGKRRIELAQRDVTDATAAAAKAQTDGARSVQKAQEALLTLSIQQAAAANQASDDAQAAMDNLSPSAQEAVRTLTGVRDRLTDIRKTVQENFFAGFSGPLKEAADVILPQLKSGLGGLAGVMGAGVQTQLTALKDSLSGGVLDGILKNVAGGLSAANGAINPLTSALTNLTSVGASFLPQLGAGFAGVSQKFGEFIARVTADGSLKEWIQGGLDALSTVGSILGSAGSILGSIFTAAKDAGGTTIDSLAAGLKTVADVVGKEPFQSSLRMIFEGANSAMSGLMGGMGPLGGMFVTLAPTIQRIFELVGKIGGEALGGIAAFMSDPAIAVGLPLLFEGILTAVQALAPSMPALAQAFGAILQVAGELIAQVGPVLAELFTQLAPVVVELAAALSPLIAALGPLLVAAIKAVMPFITLVLDVVKLLLPIITGVAEALTGIASGDWSKFLDGLGKAFQGIGDLIYGLVFVVIPKYLGSLLEKFGGLGAGIGRSVGKWFADLPKNLGTIFGELGKWFGNAGGRLMGFFGDGIRSAAEGVGKKIGEVMEWVKGFFPHSPAKRGPLSGSGWFEIGSAGEAIGESFADGIAGSTGTVGSASEALMRAVTMPKAGTYTAPANAAGGAALPGSVSVTQNIHEAISPRATATEAVRLMTAGV